MICLLVQDAFYVNGAITSLNNQSTIYEVHLIISEDNQGHYFQCNLLTARLSEDFIVAVWSCSCERFLAHGLAHGVAGGSFSYYFSL